ncbi:hypothetical protein ACWEIJ_45470 [Lentzea sp. NPDC004789]
MRYRLAFSTASATALLSPVTQALETGRIGTALPFANLQVDASRGDPISVVQTEAGRAATGEAPAVMAGWPTPNRRSWHLTSSCQRHAAAIRKGAAAWSGLTEGGGTPVECTNSYIKGCGNNPTVVGCNWGRGQRITLYITGVRDGALLAAHEFGHDWFDHSKQRCSGWSSPAQVMAPAICE